ncbi:MAG: hypothetical protein HY270_12465 [Deltaproteobacteria bacterium]|nr:hypothetical protein [Deltaproteobacteria bacterium]
MMKGLAAALGLTAVLFVSATPVHARGGGHVGGPHGGGHLGGWHGGGVHVATGAHGGGHPVPTGWHGGGHGAGWHGGWRGGIYIGGPWWWGYPYPYPYPYPYYAQPPYAVVDEEPPVYIQKQPATADSVVQGYWYYCPSSKTYYPVVPDCNEEWIKVPPAPPQ